MRDLPLRRGFVPDRGERGVHRRQPCDLHKGLTLAKRPMPRRVEPDLRFDRTGYEALEMKRGMLVLAFAGLAFLGLLKGGTRLWFTLSKNRTGSPGTCGG